MNVLERWVEEELTQVPAGPSAEELRRRVRVRRARRAAALGAVAIVLAILGIAALLQSPAPHRVQVIEPPPTPTTVPLATTAEFPPLAKIVNSVIQTVRIDTKKGAPQPSSAEIVVTTKGRADVLGAVSEARPGQPIYLVQVLGDFVCHSCFGVVGQLPHGTSFQVRFDRAGNVVGFSMGAKRPDDLNTLGTVYRLPLTRPLATAEQFPPLAKMAKIVSNNVRSDYRSSRGTTRPTSGEIVETTRGRALSLFGGSLENLDDHIYVVQVIGNFSCDHCSRPATAPPVAPHGRAIHLLFDAGGNGYGYGIGGVLDLSDLGTVYRLPLP